MHQVDTDWPISMVATETGFSNLSNFNRQFRDSRHMTPREFRRFVVKYGRMPNAKAELDLTQRSPSLEKRGKMPIPILEPRTVPPPRSDGALKSDRPSSGSRKLGYSRAKQKRERASALPCKSLPRMVWLSALNPRQLIRLLRDAHLTNQAQKSGIGSKAVNSGVGLQVPR
jgi:hypothetical protein